MALAPITLHSTSLTCTFQAHMKSSLIASTLLLMGAAISQAATLIVPVFGNTQTQYRGVLSAARQQELIAIFNPDDGAGRGRIGSVARFVNGVQSTGSLAVGYINTNYGNRDIGSIRSEIDRYASSYKADGIFLDEFSDSLSDLSLYKSIFAYAKRKGLMVIGNPGTFLPEAFAKYADIFITYEDYYSNGFSKFKQKAWMKNYPKKKFGVIVQGTNNHRGVVNRANAQGVEFVYATDNDYGSLPSDFGSLSGAVRGRGITLNAIPEPSTSVAAGLGVLGLFVRRRR